MKLMMQLPKSELFLMLECLREHTEGKLYLEAQYARCTRMYCELLLERKEGDKAADTIQEVQIETYGSLERKEKLDFILFQIWIMYSKEDFVRMYIISKKIDPPHLNEKGLEEQKVKYYQLMILYYLHEGLFMEIAQSYKTIYDTLAANKELEEKLKIKLKAYENFVWFLLISPYTNQKIDMLQNTKKFDIKQLEANPRLYQFLVAFLTEEIMPIVPDKLFEEVKTYEPFMPGGPLPNTDTHFKFLQKEFIQKDLKVVEKYYTRISM